MIKKLGLVLECAREGADEKVLKCLIRRLAPGTALPQPACMVSKNQLITDGASAAQQLLAADKCERVFIVWDLKPEWEEQEQLLNCEQECALIAEKLEALGIRNRVDLICIVEMLETWIIADDRAVRAHLTRAPRQADFRRINNPESQANPKALLISSFKGTFRTTYRDHTDAVRIIQKCPDTNRLKRVTSFTRFVGKLTGNDATAFVKCGDVCNDLARSADLPADAPKAQPAALVPSLPKLKGRPKR